MIDMDVIDEVATARAMLAPALDHVHTALESGGISDRDLIGALRLGGQLTRLADSLVVAATEQIQARSAGPREERLTTRHGARTVSDLIRTVTRTDSRTARAYERAARTAHRESALTTGELLPGDFPQLGEALRDGAIGLAGYLAATSALHHARTRLAPGVLAAADAALATAARGTTTDHTTDIDTDTETDTDAETDAADGDGSTSDETAPNDTDSGGLPALDADALAVIARGWVTYGDPDGAEPTEDRALRRRYLSLGNVRDGLVHLQGELLPDVAARLQRLLDAATNPRSHTNTTLPDNNAAGTDAAVADATDADATDAGAAGDVGSAAFAQASLDLDGPPDGWALGATTHHPGSAAPESNGHAGATTSQHAGHGDDADHTAQAGGAGVTSDTDPGDDAGDAACDCPRELPDERTGPQKRHDAFAALLGLAASAADAPTIGGAAPTLVLTMREDDYLNHTGWAHLDDINAATSPRAAQHAACTGAIQRVIHNNAGRIIAIETHERVFNAAQRRAITARDRECVIPTCHTPPAWCEIHHVTDWARGGATTTDNGVLLCWFHHRTLAINGWTIRMRHGLPEIRGPATWDPHQHWHPASRHLAHRTQPRQPRAG